MRAILDMGTGDEHKCFVCVVIVCCSLLKLTLQLFFATNTYNVAMQLSKELQIRLHWISGLILERPQCFHDRFYACARTVSWP